MTNHIPVAIELDLRAKSRPLKSPCPLSRMLDASRLVQLTAQPDESCASVTERCERLTSALKSCALSPKPRKGRPWWTADCSHAKKYTSQARVLCKSRPEFRIWFAGVKTRYRRCLRRAKLEFESQRELRLLAEAEVKSKSYVWLRHSRPSRVSCPVEPSKLHDHFTNIFAAVNTIIQQAPAFSAVWSEEDIAWREGLDANFSIAEVHEAITRLPTGKACGEDLIFNEHLKAASTLVCEWTRLFNDCLSEGVIPAQWRSCLMIVIPKGKGNPAEASSWRGICKKSCVYKLMSSILVRRLMPFIEARECLPNEQHGFRPFRSTISACRILIDAIQSTLKTAGSALYAVFVDFRAAFDTGSRELVITRLALAGVPERLLALITAILGENLIKIDDGVAIGSGIPQTSGFAQGDNLSPLLFSMLVADLPSRIMDRHHFVKILQYADDLVLYSTSRFHIQQALATLNAHVSELGLTINVQKTEAVKFRRGGRLAASDKLYLNRSPLKFSSAFTYLGVTLSTSGKSFSKHISDRTRKAISVAGLIENPHKLSLATAIELFHIKIAPCAYYGIQLIWSDLTVEDLERLHFPQTSPQAALLHQKPPGLSSRGYPPVC